MLFRQAATTAALLVAAGVITSDGTAAPASAESPAISRGVPAELDGTYRVAVFGSRGTFDGRPFATVDTRRRYEISSACTAAGCVAHGVRLDDGRVPQARAGFDVSFDGDRWVSEALEDASPCLADPSRDVPLAVRWRLTPQPDGTLTGTRTVTEVAGGAAPCAGSGGSYETPVELTPMP